jgi:hypothetical protein
VLPAELIPYVERLTFRRLPEYDLKEARKALMDCVQRLERRGLEESKQAIGSLLRNRKARSAPQFLRRPQRAKKLMTEQLLRW